MGLRGVEQHVGRRHRTKDDADVEAAVDADIGRVDGEAERCQQQRLDSLRDPDDHRARIGRLDRRGDDPLRGIAKYGRPVQRSALRRNVVENGLLGIETEHGELQLGNPTRIPKLGGLRNR
jgi:hypothetical protein